MDEPETPLAEPSPALPEPPPLSVKTTLRPPPSRLGRTAAMVHGIMLAIGVICGIMAVLMPDERGRYAAAGVLLSSAVVMWTWSVLLAIRALVRDESPAWPLAVMLIAQLEATVGMGVFWVLYKNH
jgi:hypothetical protein